MPRLCDPRVHLLARKLAASTRLGALCHLDLNLVGARQIADGHTEPAGCHLLDTTPLDALLRILLGVLATFARVALAAELVHRNSQSIVGLLADRPIRHRARLESPHDVRPGFDAIDRHGVAQAIEIENAAE